MKLAWLWMAVACVAASGARAAEVAEATVAAGEAERQRRSVLVMDLQPTNTDPRTVNLITEIVAASFADRPVFEVLTSADVRRVVGLEAERQALGCEDEASCLAEIAGAMGADLVVFGSVGELGDLFVVTLNLYDSAKVRSLGRKSIQARDLSELPEKVNSTVEVLAADFSPAPTAEGRREDAAEGSSALASPLFLGGAAALVVGLVGAGALAGLAAMQDGVIAAPTARTADKETARAVGVSSIVGSVVLGAVAVGGAAALGLAFVE